MGSESSAGRERQLAERVEVRESEIHGRGLFALKRLRKGQFIGRFEGEPTHDDGTHVLWLVDDDGEEIGIRGHNALRFLNHGESPNAEFRADELYALRNLQPGAELLIDYAPDLDEEIEESVEAVGSDRAERRKKGRKGGR